MLLTLGRKKREDIHESRQGEKLKRKRAGGWRQLVCGDFQLNYHHHHKKESIVVVISTISSILDFASTTGNKKKERRKRERDK